MANSFDQIGKSSLCALTVLVALWPLQPAQADEIEDMLVRLAAQSRAQTGSGVGANLISGGGIYGAAIVGSSNGSQGIMALNQDAGPGGGTQANIVVIALSNGPNATALARLLAEQVEIRDNIFEPSDTLPTATGVLAIVDSYKGGVGIAQINQSAGSGNLQRNATLIAAALGGGDAQAVSEADLRSLSSANPDETAAATTRGVASVSGSFTDFFGIVQVNQTVGSGNIVSNTVSFTYGVAPTGGG
jgi:hypothetical protein